MRNRTYGGVRGRKTKVGRKLLRFPPTRFLRDKGLLFQTRESSATNHYSLTFNMSKNVRNRSRTDFDGKDTMRKIL